MSDLRQQSALVEYKNRFFSKGQTLYYKGDRKTFSQFMQNIKDLADELESLYTNKQGSYKNR